MQPRRIRLAQAAAIALLCVALVAPAATGADPENTQGFRKGVTLAGVRAHQQALQAIADANGGTRLASTPGYVASAEYVAAKAAAAGLTVSSFSFQFNFNADQTPPVFQQLSPSSITYVDGVDFASMTFSPNGDVTSTLVAVDLVVPSPGAVAGRCGRTATAGDASSHHRSRSR